MKLNPRKNLKIINGIIQIMPEAYGVVAVKTVPDLLSELLKQDEVVSNSLVTHLLEYEKLSLEDTMISLCDRFELNGEVHEKQGFAILPVFGSTWMNLVCSLVRDGQSIELYCHIHSEYGEEIYAARQADGKRYLKMIDNESDDCDTQEEVRLKWLSKIPSSIREFLEN